MCRSRGFTIVVALLATPAIGCGSKGDRSVAYGKTGNETGSNEASVAAAPRDACGLIAPAEAESIVGNPLRVEPDEAESRSSSCNYMPKDDSGSGFSLKVYWTAGKEELATTKTAMGLAPKLAKQQEGMEIGGMMALEPIDGLGDEAYYNSIVGSYVLKGDRLLQFDLRLLAFGQPAGVPREKWLRLAQKAVDRP
jgi:hypothetical protein